MFSKIAPVALLSAVAFAAPAPVAAALEERSLFCSAEDIILSALKQNAQATTFCSSYLKVAPVTATVTATNFATVTALATSTVTSTVTGAKSTSTCAPQYANGQKKRGLTSSCTSFSTSAAKTTSACATPTILQGLAASLISAECGCLSIPTSTVTVSVVKTNAVTVTATTVTTAIATVSATAVAQQLYDLNGTYTASNSDVFQLYPNLDFPGNDAFEGTCGVAGDTVTTSDGTFSCLSFNDCMNICATATWGCVGASFVPSWNYCYLKNAVPGNGLTTCGTVQSEIVESGLNIAQGNIYAVSN